MDDVAHHFIFAVGGLHAQRELAVVQEHALARLDVCCERLVVGVHHAVLPFTGAHTHRQCLPLDEGHLAAGDFAHTQFGPLQIRQHRRVRAELAVDATNGVDGFPMDLMGAVGKIDAGHIQTLQNQLCQDIFRRRRWAKGGHDFGAFGNRLLLRHKVRRVRLWKGVSFRLQKWAENPFLQGFEA